jgi:hypothetical protein
MKKKASIEIGLETLVGVIIAFFSIVFIYAIISSLILAFTKQDKVQLDNFYILRNHFENLERETPFYGFVKEDYIIVGFNKNQNIAEGECKNYWLHRYRVLNIKIWNKKFNFNIEKDSLKCSNEFPCLCLCKIDVHKQTADCVNGMCFSLNTENTKDIVFGGFLADNQNDYRSHSCKIPIVYAGYNAAVVYCLKRNGGNEVVFEPGACLN